MNRRDLALLGSTAAAWRLVRVRSREGLLDRRCCPLNRNLAIAHSEQKSRSRITRSFIWQRLLAGRLLTQQEQGIIMAWLQGYYLPEHEPAVIDVEKLLSDKAKLTEHCINKPEDDVMTAAEAVME